MTGEVVARLARHDRHVGFGLRVVVDGQLGVEIAESSDRIDRADKASLYARAGIAEYWIVDLLHEAVEVHREPQSSPAALYGWLYRSVETLRPPATVAPLVALDRAIPVADLLP